MYTVLLDKHYVKQLKKLSSQKGFDLVALQNVVEILEAGSKIPSKYRDHQLRGEFSKYRELHVKHDMLLIYCKNDTELILVLVALGSHSQLFG